MDHSAYITAAAATLGLKIPAEAKAGVAMYFDLAASMAASAARPAFDRGR